MKIKDLQGVVSQLPINNRLKLDILGQKKDKVDQLYQLLKKGKVSSEEEAIKHLCANNKRPIHDLWKLKDALIERIGNTALFLVNPKLLTPHDYEKLKTYKLFLLFKFYSFTPFKNMIKYYGEKVFANAKKYEVSEICLTTAMELRHFYALVEYNPKNYEYYDNEVEKYFNIINIEMQIEKTLFNFIRKFKFKKSYSTFEIEEAKRVIAETQSLKSQAHSHKIEWRSSFLISYCYLCLKDYEKTNQTIEISLDKLKKFDFQLHRKIHFTFEFRRIPGYIINKKFKCADKAIQNCLKIANKNSHNYMLIKQHQVLKNLHQGNYQLAFNQVKDSFHEVYPLSESWEIYDAYASILTNNHFMPARFLNKVPIFTKDKRGMNINIVIIPILDLLRKRLYTKVIDRTSSIQRYIYRYLIDDESTKRGKEFLEIIVALEHGAFRKKEVLPLVQPNLLALESLPLPVARQDYEVEVVPYERLWDFIYQQLR